MLDTRHRPDERQVVVRIVHVVQDFRHGALLWEDVAVCLKNGPAPVDPTGVDSYRVGMGVSPL